MADLSHIHPCRPISRGSVLLLKVGDRDEGCLYAAGIGIKELSDDTFICCRGCSFRVEDKEHGEGVKGIKRHLHMDSICIHSSYAARREKKATATAMVPL